MVRAGDPRDVGTATWMRSGPTSGISLPCSYPERSGDLRRQVTRVSDFCSARQWHATGMYCDYLRPAGYDHEIMLCLPGGPGRTVRLMFFRGPGRDFTERDRALLALLRPHLQERRTRRRKRRRRIPALTASALGDPAPRR